MAKNTKPAMGRGLDALITMEDLHTGGSSSINEVELSKIEANPDQPRSVFDQEALEELAASIKSIGLVQPITLRETAPDHYQIISGERRFRASKIAGLTSVPAYIRKASDDNLMVMALIENIQREDLNAVEIALAYQSLIEMHKLTQEQLSEQIGKKRATIANFLRILKLPAEIQIGLKDRKIDMGHAKALLSLDDASTQLMVYEQILEYGFSVRKTEEIVKTLNEEATDEQKPADAPAKPKQKTPDEFNLLKKHLSSYLGAKVALSCNEKGAGKITISFANDKELERIVQIFDKLQNN
ncbi:MAG: ParB/RepB/Spo0J family partition protein [Dysgonamonadaceae bacterium]|jgi:ParB family chromosome partitioning protein|nr:ParB/RepB/Spo0J family partition protein [Dysgonamonadaceae bacterium]